jgi:hypothetical protein
LNKVDNRRKLDRDAAEQLEKFLGVPVFTVHNAAEVSHAAAQGIPLALAKKCKPIDDLKALIKWIEK